MGGRLAAEPCSQPTKCVVLINCECLRNIRFDPVTFTTDGMAHTVTGFLRATRFAMPLGRETLHFAPALPAIVATALMSSAGAVAAVQVASEPHHPAVVPEPCLRVPLANM